jgi:methyl-accepting chemotaxis protein
MFKKLLLSVSIAVIGLGSTAFVALLGYSHIIEGIRAHGGEVSTLATELGSLSEQYAQILEDSRSGSLDLQALARISNELSRLNSKSAALAAEIEGNLFGEVVEHTFYVRFVSVFAGIICVAFSVHLARRTVKQISQITTMLTEGAFNLRSSSFEVARTSEAFAAGSLQQSDSIKGIQASVIDMTESATMNSQSSKDALQSASTTRDVVDKTFEASQTMSTAMHDIVAAANAAADIIGKVDEIAFQTNLLALNAAVEAARAGDAGRGFAVVAEEVRNLAKRSQVAAKETGDKIRLSKSLADQGVRVADDVAELTRQLKAAGQVATEMGTAIYYASSQQNDNLMLTKQSIEELEKANLKNTATASAMASASDDLKSQANRIEEVIRRLQSVVNGKALQPHLEVAVEGPVVSSENRIY